MMRQGNLFRLKVYNVLGQIVATFVDRIEEAGTREIQYDARNVASGVYFYRLEAVDTVGANETFTQVKKLLLMN